MSNIFVIPDVHLKPWIFEKASTLVDKGTYDAVVMLGDLVVNRIQDLKNSIPPENTSFIRKIDNVVFSHAGLTESFVIRHFGRAQTDLDSIICRINRMGEAELWQDDSPIWARPQYGEMRMYPQNVFQVVGHTPVRTALEEGNLLTVDNFSTYRDGRPIGDERFVWIDMVEKKWGFAEG